MKTTENTAAFVLSAFGDEIDGDLHVQAQVLSDLQVHHLELRSVNGVNVKDFTDSAVEEYCHILADHGISVACIGSPVGKSPIQQSLQIELDNLARLIEIAHAFGTRNIRIFSFYPPDTSTNTHYDEYISESAGRLKRLAEIAAQKDAILLLENEKDIVGDTIDRCHLLMQAAGSAHLRFLWDPANFIQVGEEQPTDLGWDQLGDWVGHVHIKDACMVDGRVVPAGEGDGQLAELLAALKAACYCGYLSLEPHLAVAGHSSGFTGPEKMGMAVKALRTLLSETGIEEKHQVL